MRIVTFLCCFLVASLAMAKDFKVGTVDLQKLFKEYPGTKTAQKKFENMAQKKKDDLTDSAQEIKDLEKELSTSSSVWSATKRKQKEAEYQRKVQDFNQAQDQVRSDLAAKEGEMTSAILDDIKTLVANAAKDNGVDLVLDSDKTVYVKDPVDLTAAVMKNYKKVSDSSDDSDSKKN